MWVREIVDEYSAAWFKTEYLCLQNDSSRQILQTRKKKKQICLWKISAEKPPGTELKSKMKKCLLDIQIATIEQQEYTGSPWACAVYMCQVTKLPFRPLSEDRTIIMRPWSRSYATFSLHFHMGLHNQVKVKSV